jgi:hypothetical protein
MYGRAAINVHQIWIDGKRIFRNVQPNNGYTLMTEPLPIAKDQTLRYVLEEGTFDNVSCLFIPLKFGVIKNSTLVVEEGSDYSFDEQPVMIRLPDGTIKQKTWIDGKPIFFRTYAPTEAIGANSDVNLSSLGTISYVDTLLETKMFATNVNGQKRVSGGLFEVFLFSSPVVWRISSSSSAAIAANQLKFIAYYTKV